MHGLFEAQAIATPDATALISGGEQFTYRHLDEWHRAVADTVLRRLGVKPETLVGLCVERSPELVSGILGILKAGGAYVPLEPSHPHQRLELILADSGASIVLTHSRLSIAWRSPQPTSSASTNLSDCRCRTTRFRTTLARRTRTWRM